MYRFLAAASICFVFLSAAGAAERRAVATGDWSAKTTWADGIPGDGDTVDIPDGCTVTISDRRIVGRSAENASVAITMGKTGSLVIAPGGQLRVRGDVVYTAGDKDTGALVSVQAGGHWCWDASKAGKPAETHYSLRPAAQFGFRPFILKGTAAAPALLDSDAAGGAGSFSRSANGIGGPFVAAFAQISRIGDDRLPGWDIYWQDRGVGNEVTWDVQNSTFSECGLIRIEGSVHANGVFRHNRNLHERSHGLLESKNPDSQAVFNFLPLYVPIGKEGIREISANVFDVAVVRTERASAVDCTITGNYFGGSFGVTPRSGPVAKCEWNLFRTVTQVCWIPGNRTANSLVLIDCFWDNPHVLFGVDRPIDLDGMILSHAGAGNSDSGEWNYCLPGIHHSIFLPNMYGYSTGEMTATGGGSPGGYIYEHNTWFGGYNTGRSQSKSAPGFAAFQYSESGNNKPGDVKLFRSNIMWNPQLPGKTSNFVKMCDIHSLYGDQKAGPPIQNVGDPTNIDYNAGWNYDSNDMLDFPNKGHYANYGRGYIGNWSRTPGEHDVDVDPMFVDYQRDLPLYATKVLKQVPTRGTWQAKPDKPYAVGDTVLVASDIYWGLPILFRYIGAGLNPEPGAGTRKTGTAPVPDPTAGTRSEAWRKSWEWASLYDLREDIHNGKKYGGDDPIMHLIKWIRAGYAPTNPKLKGAAHDGTDIGAVPWQEKRGP